MPGRVEPCLPLRAASGLANQVEPSLPSPTVPWRVVSQPVRRCLAAPCLPRLVGSGHALAQPSTIRSGLPCLPRRAAPAPCRTQSSMAGRAKSYPSRACLALPDHGGSGAAQPVPGPVSSRLPSPVRPSRIVSRLALPCLPCRVPPTVSCRVRHRQACLIEPCLTSACPAEPCLAKPDTACRVTLSLPV